MPDEELDENVPAESEAATDGQPQSDVSVFDSIVGRAVESLAARAITDAEHRAAILAVLLQEPTPTAQAILTALSFEEHDNESA